MALISPKDDLVFEIFIGGASQKTQNTLNNYQNHRISMTAPVADECAKNSSRFAPNFSNLIKHESNLIENEKAIQLKMEPI